MSDLVTAAAQRLVCNVPATLSGRHGDVIRVKGRLRLNPSVSLRVSDCIKIFGGRAHETTVRMETWPFPDIEIRVGVALC